MTRRRARLSRERLGAANAPYHRRVIHAPSIRRCPAPGRRASSGSSRCRPEVAALAPMDAAEAFRDLPGLALLESARPGRRSRWTYLCADPIAVLEAPSEGPDAFADARRLLGRLAGGDPAPADGRPGAPPFLRRPRRLPGLRPGPRLRASGDLRPRRPGPAPAPARPVRLGRGLGSAHRPRLARRPGRGRRPRPPRPSPGRSSASALGRPSPATRPPSAASDADGRLRRAALRLEPRPARPSRPGSRPSATPSPAARSTRRTSPAG